MTRSRIQSGPAPFDGAGPSLQGLSALPRRPRNLVREDILDAVDVQLEALGYSRMTIEDVARQAGIGKGSIYLHFASKEDLALSSIDRMVSRLLMRLEAIAGEPVPPADRLHRMLLTRVLFRFDHVRQDSQSLDEMLAVIRTALLARREEWFEREAELLARVIRDAHPASPEDDVLRDARALITATNSLLPYSLSKAELGRRSRLDERVTALADVLLRGIDAGPRAARPHDTTGAPLRSDVPTPASDADPLPSTDRGS